MGMAVITERPSGEEIRVGLSAEEAGRRLEMALHTKRVVIGHQQLVVDRSVRRMTIFAALFRPQMFEDEGSSDVYMAAIASRILTLKRCVLWCLTVNRMTVCTIHLPLRHAVMKLQIELGLDRRVALIAERFVALLIHHRRNLGDTGRRRMEIVRMAIPTTDLGPRMV